VSGRHSKPTFCSLHAADIKTVGGIIAGAGLAGAIAASAAFTTPNTASHLVGQRALADVAVLRADTGPLSRHETHSRHQAHSDHATRAAPRSDRAESSPKSSKSSRSAKPSKPSGHKAAGRTRRASAQAAIHLAKSQVGISEDKSGETKFNKWYMDDPRAERTLKRDGGSLSAYKDAAWCDMFVSWIGYKLGVSGSIGSDAYAVKHAEWFKDRGRWGHQPRPGAVTFFGWNGDKIDDIEHVGFTIKDNHDGTIKTVEGNTHNTVAIRTRKKSFVVGYGYPDYKK
jgi:hypothetical protein